MNPDVQISLCKDVTKCYTANYPTLRDLDVAYFEGESASWILNMITDIVEFCGAKDSLNERQKIHLSSMIADTYRHYKISEFMLFCYRFKSGRYGRFYGHIDPMVIMQAIAKYDNERIDELDKIEQKKREEREAEYAKNAVTFEEWLEMTGKPKDYKIELKTEYKPKQKKKTNENKEQILEYARNVINEQNENVRSTMEKFFISKYNITPNEYIKQQTT